MYCTDSNFTGMKMQPKMNLYYVERGKKSLKSDDCYAASYLNAKSLRCL